MARRVRVSVAVVFWSANRTATTSSTKGILLTDPYTSATRAAAIRTLHAKDEGCISYTVLAIEPAWAPASNHEF